MPNREANVATHFRLSIVDCRLRIGRRTGWALPVRFSSNRQSKIANRQLPGAWLLLLTSCATPAPTPMDYTVRHVQQRERSAALDDAEAALIDLGYQIERRDPAEAVITTQPVEAQAGLDSTRSASLSSRGRTRRIVEVRVASEGSAAKIFCKVLIQEQSAQAYRMFAADRGGSDTPGDYTAINRDAATTTGQNMVWRTLRRDKSVERVILDAITERAGGEVQVPANPG